MTIDRFDIPLRRLHGTEAFESVNRIAREYGYSDGVAMCHDMSYWTLTLRELLAAYPDPGTGRLPRRV